MIRSNSNVYNGWTRPESESHISRNTPNEETIKTIEESKLGINTNFYKSRQDFFDYLDNLQKKVDKELSEKNR